MPTDPSAVLQGLPSVPCATSECLSPDPSSPRAHPQLNVTHSPFTFMWNSPLMKLIKISDFHMCLCLCLGGGEAGMIPGTAGGRSETLLDKQWLDSAP